MRELLDLPWQTLSIPSALTPIGQLHQSPPSPSKKRVLDEFGNATRGKEFVSAGDATIGGGSASHKRSSTLPARWTRCANKWVQCLLVLKYAATKVQAAKHRWQSTSAVCSARKGRRR